MKVPFRGTNINKSGAKNLKFNEHDICLLILQFFAKLVLIFVPRKGTPMLSSFLKDSLLGPEECVAVTIHNCP